MTPFQVGRNYPHQHFRPPQANKIVHGNIPRFQAAITGGPNTMNAIDHLVLPNEHGRQHPVGGHGLNEGRILIFVHRRKKFCHGMRQQRVKVFHPANNTHGGPPPGILPRPPPPARRGGTPRQHPPIAKPAAAASLYAWAAANPLMRRRFCHRPGR